MDAREDSVAETMALGACSAVAARMKVRIVGISEREAGRIVGGESEDIFDRWDGYDGYSRRLGGLRKRLKGNLLGS